MVRHVAKTSNVCSILVCDVLHLIIRNVDLVCIQLDGYVVMQVQTNDLFGDSFSATPSTASDGFEVSAFQATPGPSPFQTASSTAPAASDPFGSSSFHLAPPPPPPVAYQPPTAPPSNFGGNSMHGFGAPGVSNGTGTNGTTFGQSPTPFDTAAHNTGFSQASGLGYGNNQGFPRQQSFSGMPQASSANQSPYGVQQNMGGLHRSASAPHELHQPQPQPPRPQQPARKEFGPVKSAIWGDTLSMGLVDLNIAGRKLFHFVHIIFFVWLAHFYPAGRFLFFILVSLATMWRSSLFSLH